MGISRSVEDMVLVCYESLITTECHKLESQIWGSKIAVSKTIINKQVYELVLLLVFCTLCIT
jgi:hypothetical protein